LQGTVEDQPGQHGCTSQHCAYLLIWQTWGTGMQPE
jgi:hypothetical protein